MHITQLVRVFLFEQKRIADKQEQNEQQGKQIQAAVFHGVVLFGMKLVGICEKISVFAMVGVIGVLFVATLIAGYSDFPSKFISSSNMIALYSIVSFSLSAVMSVPQVVKGLDGDSKKIKSSIAAGTGINVGLIIIITFIA